MCSIQIVINRSKVRMKKKVFLFKFLDLDESSELNFNEFNEKCSIKEAHSSSNSHDYKRKYYFNV